MVISLVGQALVTLSALLEEAPIALLEEILVALAEEASVAEIEEALVAQVEEAPVAQKPNWLPLSYMYKKAMCKIEFALLLK